MYFVYTRLGRARDAQRDALAALACDRSLLRYLRAGSGRGSGDAGAGRQEEAAVAEEGGASKVSQGEAEGRRAQAEMDAKARCLKNGRRLLRASEMLSTNLAPTA
jgi:hypothetical protein